jgi:hypothetical protein
MDKMPLRGHVENRGTDTQTSNPSDLAPHPDSPASESRRKFLGNISGAAVAALTAGAIGMEPLLGGKESVAHASVVPYRPDSHEDKSFDYRVETAKSEKIENREQPDNGDARRFTDFSGNYSKASLHDGLGVPNAASWLSLKHALKTGEFEDFENIIVGTPGGGPNSRHN